MPTRFPTKPIRLAVVGEAPGFQEAARGRPFVGPSGQLLNQVLRQVGYEESEVMYTNVCLCRPPDNATPTRAATAACRPRLLNELRTSGVSDVLTLGGTAASALVDDSRTITHLRVGPPKKPTSALDDSSIQRVVATWHTAYCVAPNTRILTTDLRWAAARELQLGDELVGFDEHLRAEDYARRQFKPATVTAVEQLTLPCFEVCTSKGVMICSSDHMWLARKRKSYHTPTNWIRTENLTPDYDLLHFIEPWEVDNSREAGYVAGFLDGEGWVSHPNGLGWAQNDGDTATLVSKLVEEKGFRLTKGYVGNCGRYYMGGPRDSIRALGIFRPQRLLPKADKLWQRQCNVKRAPILSVRPIGPQEVISISTSTRTFIAEGFMSHNCLRNADAFPAFTTDVAKLREGDRPAWRPPEWRYFDDPEIAIAALDELERRADTLVVDIEVGIEKDFAFGHPNEYDLLCVGLGYARGKVVVIGDRALKSGAALDRLRKLLRRVKIVAHNGKFDLGGLYPHLGGLELWFDTMLASYCLDERPGNHGLKVLAVEKLGAPQYDLEIRQYVPKRGNYADIPRALLYKYNAYDVACTYDLYEMFSQSLESTPGLRALHDFLVAASNQLMYLELNGITIDRAYASTLRGIFLKRLEEIEARLDDIVKRAWTDKEMKGHLTVGPKVEGLPSWDPQSGGPKVTEDPYLVVVTEKVQPFPSGINPRSPKQVKEYLASQSIRVDSTNVEVLKILGERLAPDTDASRFVYELLKYRRQHKLYSTYVEGIRKRTYRGRVYTTYMLHGTTSGRLASRNPNLQNIVRDKDIRRQFGVSRPGNVLIQCDYKQAEARVMATLAQDEYLRTILSRDEPGYDFFDELSDQLYGPGNWRKDVERIRTKAFFYGLGYGRQAYSIALEYSMSVREAEQRLQEFMSLIPATVAWQKKVRNEVLAGNDLVTTFGRHRRFWLITEQNKKDVMNEALSFLPQSTASDICLRAATRVRPRMRGLGFLRLTIHDALTAECAADKQDEVGQILIDEMTRSGQEWTDYVPFPVDVKVGTSWGDFA